MASSKNLQYFSLRLLDWYNEAKRDLPWRRDQDPYRVWVSEIMLQQTRVDTVIPYYERFMDKFPTLQALAEAPEDEVLKAWEGLGYYSRARNLQSAVREVCASYGGKVPDDPEEIARLRGVGPYTAGAILSIAYNLPEPAVDGNVMRVLSRFFLIEEDIMRPATRTRFEKLVRELIPAGEARNFNQAMMELGALICTPKSPLCLICPVMEHCSARLAGKELELPIKKKAKAPKREFRAAALIEGAGADYRDKVLLRRRPEEGLLAGMWELPHVEIDAATWRSEEGWMAELQLRLGEQGVHVQPFEPLDEFVHIFSHIRWEMKVTRCVDQGLALVEDNAEYRWVSRDELEAYTFPKVFNRILDAYVREV